MFPNLGDVASVGEVLVAPAEYSPLVRATCFGVSLCRFSGSFCCVKLTTMSGLVDVATPIWLFARTLFVEAFGSCLMGLGLRQLVSGAQERSWSYVTAHWCV